MEQRLVWAMIIIVSRSDPSHQHFVLVALKRSGLAPRSPQFKTTANFTKAIGMSMTSGQSIFGFIGRVLGTAIAMVFSIVIWYIVDQKTPGIIVMLWLFVFLEMYFFIKFPRFIPIFLVAIVTQILIIGYELQVRKTGIAAGVCSGLSPLPCL